MSEMVANFEGTVVLVQGSSASGKSRLIDGVNRIIRETGLELEVEFPKRYTTRAPREAETYSGENVHLSEEAFRSDVRLGRIDVFWRRSTGQRRENLYGFGLGAHLGSGRRVILSANNYLSWNEHDLLLCLRRVGRLVVVRVVASDATRARRLAARRPPISKEELEFRMRDVPPESLPAADYIIPNDEQQQPFAEWEFCRLLSLLKLGAVRGRAA